MGKSIAMGASLGSLLLLMASPSSGQGISWPAGQVLPRFAAFSELDVADISGLPFDRKASLSILQGLVNRTKTRLYLLDAQQSGEGKNFWIDRMAVPKTRIADPLSLFTKYRADLTGLCVWDPTVPGSIDVAVTAAGVTGCVAASPEFAAVLSAAPYGIPVSLDLRQRKFADDRAAYAWAKAEYWARCSHRMLSGMKPGVHYPLFDLIVANKAFCAWLDPGEPLDKPLLDALFADMPVNGVFVGWWAGETRGVTYASGHGVMTFASDWFSNATVHAGGAAALGTLPETLPPPAVSRKAHIAFILSDGDNLQEQEHLFPKRWASPLRGTFPVSWTQSPALADLAPAMLAYYYASRTPNDCFITGPSGVGYVLPEFMKADHMREFARMTETYLRHTGIRTLTVWGSSAAASDIFGKECPSVIGIANKQGGAAPMGPRAWAGGLASVEMDPDYASFASQIIPVIDRKMAAWDRKGPLFIAPQLNANVAGLEEFKLVFDHYKGNPEVTFVRADQMFQLMRAGNPTAVRPEAPIRASVRRGGGAGLYFTESGMPADLRGRSFPVQGTGGLSSTVLKPMRSPE